MKRFCLVFLAFLTVHCADNPKNKILPGGNGGGDDENNEKVQRGDLTKLSTEEALKKKYEKLNYACTFSSTLTRAMNDRVRSFENKEVRILWDIINDYSEKKEINYTYRHRNIRYRVQWNMELNIALKNKHTHYHPLPNNKEVVYELTEPAILTGPLKSKIIERDYELYLTSLKL